MSTFRHLNQATPSTPLKKRFAPIEENLTPPTKFIEQSPPTRGKNSTSNLDDLYYHKTENLIPAPTKYVGSNHLNYQYTDSFSSDKENQSFSKTEVMSF
jgi:hypothetical protein